jgi:hypothetical protein
LWELKTHRSKLIFCLRTQSMRSRSPEIRNRSSNRRIILMRMRIHISRISNLSLRRRINAMNLTTRKALQPRKVKCFRQGVHTRMLEELIARLINGRSRGVALQVSGPCDFAGEVVACVEELEETSYGVEIFVYKVNSSLLYLKIRFLPKVSSGKLTLTETSSWNFAQASANQGLVVSRA